MNWSELQLWGFLAGLGLFLLGMTMLEQGLRGLASSRLRTFLRDRTSSPIRGVITGALATAFVQSSSLVGLITLAFVGAGILELRNALGIIFGSNLGTTFTGWLVTAIGFKLNLGEFANPILAIGAMGTVFLRRETRFYFYSNVILGMGLLLLGLAEMKGSFEVLQEHVAVELLRGYSPVVYLLVGAAFTAVVQSSSASMMILLSALHAGVIDLHAAAALVIGADLGTTSTVLLGALKGSVDKRRVALSHLLFNLATDLIAFLCLPLFLVFITRVLDISDPLYSLVMFHSLFNLVGIALFVPFVDIFIRILHRLVEDTGEQDRACLHIHKVPAEVTEAAIATVKKELTGIVLATLRLNLRCFRIPFEQVLKQSQQELRIPAGDQSMRYEERYDRLKQAEGELLIYTYSIQNFNQEEGPARAVTELSHAIRNVAYAAKYIKDIRANLAEFSHSNNDEVQKYTADFQRGFQHTCIRLAELLEENRGDSGSARYQQLRDDIRSNYENIVQIWRSVATSSTLTTGEVSTFITLNRSVYLSSIALLEAVRILVDVKEADELRTPGRNGAAR